MKKWRLRFRKIIVIIMTAVLFAGGAGSYMALPVQAKEADAGDATSESREEDNSAEIIADTENDETEDAAEADTGKADVSTDSSAESITGTDLPSEDVNEEDVNKEDAEEESAEEETVVVVDGLSDLPDNDEMLTGYIDQLFYENGGIGISALGNVGTQKLTDATEKKIYNDLKAAIEKIAAGTTTSTVIRISGISYSQSLFNSSKKVVSYLLMDCPYDFYWFDKTSGCALAYSGTALSFSFSVAEEYRGSEQYRTDSAKTGAATKAVATAKAIVAKHASKPDKEKLNSYCDEICNLVDYNTAAASTATAYGNPWQLIWVFDGDTNTKVVCEGYSKAFQYLCDLSTFKNADTACYTVTGLMGDVTGSGGHMWNVVTLGGENYLADVTNSDSGSFSNKYLFLAVPNSGTVDTNYIFNIGSQSIIYKYDADQITLLGKKILQLYNINTHEPKYEDNSGSSTGTNPGTGTGTTTVTKPAAPASKSVTLSLNGQSLKNNTTLKVTYNKKYTLKATVISTAGKKLTSGNGKITWKSSNTKIATVTSGGKVTIKKKAGTVTITAKTADGKTAKVKLKAAKAAVKVTKVKITGSKAMSLKKKKTQTLKATVTPASAANQKVTWKSSNKKIATVNSKGKVTAKKTGTVTITATAKDGSKKKATIKIKIKK